MKDLMIIGAGGFAREVAWLVEDINSLTEMWNLIGYIDEDESKQGVELNGYPVIGTFDDLKISTDIYAVCAVGSPRAKSLLVKKAKRKGFKFANLIHPHVWKSKHFVSGVGIIICAGNILTVNLTLGNHVILNLGCTVGHDSTIKDYCTIAPSVNISGGVIIEEGCELGTNSSIIQGKTIGKWSIVGAGAVVTKDIPEYCTAVGVPANPIKND